eukprot:820147-Ditylum_brightwellii.AAC.1
MCIRDSPQGVSQTATTAGIMLEFLIAVAELGTLQRIELEKKTKTWADRVRSGYLQPSDAWHYYQTTIQKSLEHPLLATTLSADDCQ